ncbi:MAG: hypothetical protein AAGA31_16405 [Bacteroidota bacterium]
MRILFILSVLFFLLLAGACKEETAAPLDLSKDFSYFPLELDRPTYYRVDSIVLLSEVGGVRYDTATAEVRETLVEMFEEPDGTTTYRGERWQRADEASPWVFSQTYTLRLLEGQALRREDNLTFTKLVFPLRENKRWDGHSFFDETRDLIIGGEFLDVFNGWEYRYEEVAAPIVLATGVSFEESLLVRQAEIDNLIDLRLATERYAPGVGLIERTIDARHTQCRNCCNGNTANCINLAWNDKAEKGFILQQTFLRQE